MTLSLISHSNTDTVGTSVTKNMTVSGTDRVLVVFASSWSGAVLKNVTWNETESFTNLIEQSLGGNICTVWYLVNPASATAQVIGSSDVSGNLTMTVMLFNGALQDIIDVSTVDVGYGTNIVSSTLAVPETGCIGACMWLSPTWDIISEGGATKLGYMGSLGDLYSGYGATSVLGYPDNSYKEIEASDYGDEMGILNVVVRPVASASSAIKTVNGLAKASVKTVNGLAIASAKTINGLA